MECHQNRKRFQAVLPANDSNPGAFRLVGTACG